MVKYVTKEEFTEFSTTVLEAIRGKQSDIVVPVAPPVPDDADPNENPIPPAWRKAVDEILGADFGISVSYPNDGSGFLFRIIVPKEKSNASTSHWTMYKTDIRTKSLNNAEGLPGIKQYCELVKRNLSKKN